MCHCVNDLVILCKLFLKTILLRYHCSIVYVSALRSYFFLDFLSIFNLNTLIKNVGEKDTVYYSIQLGRLV